MAAGEVVRNGYIRLLEVVWPNPGISFPGRDRGPVRRVSANGLQPKCHKDLHFAIVCGLVWQPIINTAIKSYSNVGVTRQVAQVSNQTQQLQNTEDHGSPEEVKSAVKSTAPAVTEALKQFPNVQDTEKNRRSPRALTRPCSLWKRQPASAGH